MIDIDATSMLEFSQQKKRKQVYGDIKINNCIFKSFVAELGYIFIQLYISTK